jgi:hypothetical protein
LEELLSPADVATRCSVSEAAVYKAIREERLPCVRILGRIGVKPEEADRFEWASWGGVRRNFKTRGPGRPKKKKEAS